MSDRATTSYFITGGAGFIGANLSNYLLDETDARVTVYDNFSTGRKEHFGQRVDDPRLQIIEGDLRDTGPLRAALAGHEAVYHFASNSDIARAAKEPSIDFDNGTVLTHCILEAMRETGVKRILFTSGSGVYGEVPPEPIPEAWPHMIPVSTYGACKLACEALIAAYAFMFDMRGTVFRFANVVGPMQTHGVAYDFIQRLHREPGHLLIYGDGTQSKPYIHISDVIAAFRHIEQSQEPHYDVYNVASEDFLTVSEIADIVTERMGLSGVRYDYTGGSRGWKADVPLYRLDTTKIRSTGWTNRMNSRDAVTASVEAMLREGHSA